MLTVERRDEYVYAGRFTAVKEVVRAWERQHQEVLVPLTNARLIAEDPDIGTCL